MIDALIPVDFAVTELHMDHLSVIRNLHNAGVNPGVRVDVLARIADDASRTFLDIKDETASHDMHEVCAHFGHMIMTRYAHDSSDEPSFGQFQQLDKTRQSRTVMAWASFLDLLLTSPTLSQITKPSVRLSEEWCTSEPPVGIDLMDIEQPQIHVMRKIPEGAKKPIDQPAITKVAEGPFWLHNSRTIALILPMSDPTPEYAAKYEAHYKRRFNPSRFATIIPFLKPSAVVHPPYELI